MRRLPIRMAIMYQMKVLLQRIAFPPTGNFLVDFRLRTLNNTPPQASGREINHLNVPELGYERLPEIRSKSRRSSQVIQSLQSDDLDTIAEFFPGFGSVQAIGGVDHQKRSSLAGCRHCLQKWTARSPQLDSLSIPIRGDLQLCQFKNSGNTGWHLLVPSCS